MRKWRERKGIIHLGKLCPELGVFKKKLQVEFNKKREIKIYERVEAILEEIDRRIYN